MLVVVGMAIDSVAHESAFMRFGITSSTSGLRIARNSKPLQCMGAFFVAIRRSAGQLTPLDRWCLILSHALIKYLQGRKLEPPWRMQDEGTTALG